LCTPACSVTPNCSNDFTYERDGIDFICFTDDPELRSDFWKIELLPRGMLDPARAAKKLKALAHVYLAPYDWSLYVDNTVRLKTAPKPVFEEFLAPSKSALTCFRHHERDCIYEEAKAVLSQGLDTPGRVNAPDGALQVLGAIRRSTGWPRERCCCASHHDPALQRVMDTWYEQILCHSRRDQLSLLPSCWSEGFAPEYIRPASTAAAAGLAVLRTTCACRETSTTRCISNSTRSANVNIDPRKHYLLSGQSENRRYRRLGIAELASSPLLVLRRFKQQSFLRNF